MTSVAEEYKALFDELCDAGITNISRAEFIELLKIDAIYGLSIAIRDCFESNNKLPSIP